MRLSNPVVSFEQGEVVYTGKNEDGKYMSVYGPSKNDKLLLGIEYQIATQENRPMQLNDDEQSL